MPTIDEAFTIGDARTFKSGRELASFIGLVPQQHGTGGKLRLGHISKRGDPYLRTLLIHGPRAVLFGSKTPNPWTEALLGRVDRQMSSSLPWPTRWPGRHGRFWRTTDPTRGVAYPRDRFSADRRQ